MGNISIVSVTSFFWVQTCSHTCSTRLHLFFFFPSLITEKSPVWSFFFKCSAISSLYYLVARSFYLYSCWFEHDLYQREAADLTSFLGRRSRQQPIRTSCRFSRATWEASLIIARAVLLAPAESRWIDGREASSWGFCVGACVSEAGSFPASLEHADKVDASPRAFYLKWNGDD